MIYFNRPLENVLCADDRGPVMVNFIPPKESPKATSILRKPSPKQEREMEMKKRKRYV